MSFLTPTLIAGILLVGVPIALHLAMRRQPQRMLFPALRLLQKNQRQNETRLRLRRWLLLLLRCAAVALLALALARPVVRPKSDAGAAVGTGQAVAVVIDNGPNMLYQFGNQTRLEAAKESARWLLDQLPSEAVVVSSDRGQNSLVAEGDPDAAALRLERLTTASATRPLGAALREAIERLAETPAGVREAFLYTDLSRGAWTEQSLEEISNAMDRLPNLVLRVVDVGAGRPQNISVVSLEMANEAPVVGEPVRLSAQLDASGAWPGGVVVQLWLDGGAAGDSVKRDERRIEITGVDDEQPVIEFALEGLEEGLYSGEVRVVSGDALTVDNARHFCFRVREAPSVLIAAQREEDALFVREALSPTNPAPGVPRRFATRVVRHDQLAQTDWGAESALLLLDPAELAARDWRRLADFAAAGGGVGLFLGRNASLEAFNQPVVQALAPGSLRWRSREETYLRPMDYAHPALAPLARYAETLPWAAYPVFQSWRLEALAEGALVVAHYADAQPAIVERVLGRGRVVLMTTPLSDRLDEPDPWNLLPTGEDPWPFFLLIDALTDHLSGGRGDSAMHASGETVTVPLPPEIDLPSYVLRTPSGDPVRQTTPPGVQELTIGFATEPGVYRIEAGGQAARFNRRFAVNLAPGLVRLERTPIGEIESVLGAERVDWVEDRESLSRGLDRGRIGRELYGLALALVAAAFAAEQIVSNRFYRERRET